MKILRVFIRGAIKLFISIMFRVKIIGKENVPKQGAYIICANHISNWDPVMIVVYTKRFVIPLAKEELYKSKFLTFILNVFEGFPVKRDGGDMEAVKYALKVLKSGKTMGLFPEGTRNGMEKGIKIKNGAVLMAIKAGVPIIPVGINTKKYKFRGKVRLSYGNPIHYDRDKIDTKNKEQVDNLTNELMSEIVRLRDM